MSGISTTLARAVAEREELRRELTALKLTHRVLLEHLAQVRYNLLQALDVTKRWSGLDAWCLEISQSKVANTDKIGRELARRRHALAVLTERALYESRKTLSAPWAP